MELSLPAKDSMRLCLEREYDLRYNSSPLQDQRYKENRISFINRAIAIAEKGKINPHEPDSDIIRGVCKEEGIILEAEAGSDEHRYHHSKGIRGIVYSNESGKQERDYFQWRLENHASNSGWHDLKKYLEKKNKALKPASFPQKVK